MSGGKNEGNSHGIGQCCPWVRAEGAMPSYRVGREFVPVKARIPEVERGEGPEVYS